MIKFGNPVALLDFLKFKTKPSSNDPAPFQRIREIGREEKAADEKAADEARRKAEADAQKRKGAAAARTLISGTGQVGVGDTTKSSLLGG